MLLKVLSSLPSAIWWMLGLLALLKLATFFLRAPAVKGALGEWLVAHKLRHGLTGEYTVLNDIYLPLRDGTSTQIDHIVVSPYGIFAVETKNYSGWIFADVRSKMWTQTIYRKKSTFQNPMRQNYLHVCAIADNLGIEKEYVRGVVVFLGGCTFKTERPQGVEYVGGAVGYIRSFKSMIIKPSQVPEIADAIQEWQGTLSKADRDSHVSNLKRKRAGVPEDAAPVCPRCGGQMVLRTAKRAGSRFWGCASYPKCRGLLRVRESVS